MCRAKLGIEVAVLLLLGIGLAAAQEGIDIIVAGEIVARVRDKGAHDSMEQRAEAINEAIKEVIANEDLATVAVSLQDLNGRYTVFVGERQIMSVYPAEAEAQGLLPQALGHIWVSNLTAQLRKAAEGETPEPTPPEPTGEEPATEAVTNVGGGEVEVVEVAVGGEAPPRTAAVQGAKYLILDAFSKIRKLDEAGYTSARDGLAGALLNNLVQVWTGGAESVGIEEPAVGVAPMEGSDTTPAEGTEHVEVTPLGPGPADISDLISEEELYEGIPEGDPNWAKVPQKRRIQKKFELAREPYLDLKGRDPQAAAQVDELLAAARKELTAKDFDACEQHLDYALRMLGVIR